MRSVWALAGVVALAACHGNPLNNGGPSSATSTTSTSTTSSATSVPSDLAGNLVSATYDPNANGGQGALTVVLDSLDASIANAVYTRNAALDVPGFRAFTTQDGSLQRKFVALVATTPDGILQSGVVGDGGQFVNYFAGTYYNRLGGVTLPTTGLASYTGKYAGILNTGNGTTIVSPVQAYRTTGDFQINADFGSKTINGAVYNRQVVDSVVVGIPTTLPDVGLEVNAIDANGAFKGRTMWSNLSVNGGYGGVLGGTNAPDIAGVMVFQPIQGLSTLKEHGAFIGGCVPPGNAIPCP